MYTFTVIMPVYNASGKIRKSINSVLKQTYQDFEIIAIDDGSVDDSLSVLKELELFNNKLKVLHQDNKGPGAARNYGISKSMSHYIAFLDADDYWEPDFLENIIKNSDDLTADIIFYDVIKEREDGSVIYESNNYECKKLPKQTLIEYQMTGKLPWGMIKVVNRKLLLSVKEGFSNLAVGEEALISYELLKYSNNIKFVEKPIYHYVQSSSGQHTQGNLDPWKKLVQLMTAYMVSNGEYERYKSTINSLALKALCISIYRCSQGNNLLEASKLVKQKYIEYATEYNLNDLNLAALDRNSVLIHKVLKIKLYWLLVMLSKYRKRKLAY